MFKKKPAYEKYTRRRMTRRKRRTWILIAVLAAVILAALAGTWVLVNYSKLPEVVYSGMEEASLPTITCVYKGKKINRMYGYTKEMDAHYMRDTLFILQDTYQLPVFIEDAAVPVTALSYRLKDLASNSLIQSSDATDMLTEEAGGYSASLSIENMIEEEKEYALEILLSTQQHETIRYYCRIMHASAPFLEDHIALIEKAHKATYDYDDAEEVFSPYKAENDYLYDDTTSFSRITLYSTVGWLSWDEMIIEETLAPTINLVDYDNELGFFRLDYQVGRELDQNDPEHYNVSEYFRTRINGTNTYLLDYERTVNQIFEPSGSRVSSDHINLGFLADENVESLCSPDGNQTAFAVGGALWMLSAKTKELTSIFNFTSDLSDRRDLYNQHNIDIVDVTDDGNVRFLVYGYMNKGIHEGESGIGLYTFRFNNLEVTEEAFLPADIPFPLLQHAIGELCYMNDAGHLYLMINGNVYAIDPETNEASLVVSGLSEDVCKVSEDHSMLAWQEDGKINNATTIHVLNMNTLETYTVSADEGKCIKVLGFLNNDLIYGQGDSGKLYTDANDKKYLLMSHLYAASSSGQIQNEDSENGYYFISATQEYNRLIVDRVYEMEQAFRTTDAFTIFATELSEYPKAATYNAMEETRGQVVLLSLPVSNSAVTPLNIITSTKATFSSAEVSDAAPMADADWQYLVYAHGQFLSPESSPAQAVLSAYEAAGCVVKPDGTYFYRRGMRAATAELAQEPIAAAAAAYRKGTVLNVTGIELAQAMSFTARRLPLIWERDDAVYIIAGYTVSDALQLYDIETGQTSYLSYNEADRNFTKSGKLFVYETD